MDAKSEFPLTCLTMLAPPCKKKNNRKRKFYFWGALPSHWYHVSQSLTSLPSWSLLLTKGRLWHLDPSLSPASADDTILGDSHVDIDDPTNIMGLSSPLWGSPWGLFSTHSHSTIWDFIVNGICSTSTIVVETPSSPSIFLAKQIPWALLFQYFGTFDTFLTCLPIRSLLTAFAYPRFHFANTLNSLVPLSGKILLLDESKYWLSPWKHTQFYHD